MQSYTTFRQQVAEDRTNCTQQLETMLDVIEQRRSLNAFLQTDVEGARVAARESDNRFHENTARPLEGMVVALKDNISCKGMRLTCGSKILGNFQPVYDASVVARLRTAGAIIIGKTNCDEFAMGSSNENSAFGPVGHPLNPAYVPGGSSGGSAVALASGMCHLSLGSDTGGSIRQPAAFCGVVGFKPTYGRISRYGLVAFASSLDQIGPFSSSIEDAALFLDAVSGVDEHDSTSVAETATRSRLALDHHDEHVRVGILEESILEGCSADVIECYKICVEKIREMGYDIETVNLPAREAWIPTYYILATAEASANLARFDGVRYGYRAEVEDDQDWMAQTRSQGFGDEVKRRIMLGTYVLSGGYYDAYYKKGQQARRLVYDGYAQIFTRCDVLFMPTTPTTAFRRGEKSTNPIEMYLNDLFTVSANLAGVPAISIPAGNNTDGFPIGMQLQCAAMHDEKLLRISRNIMNHIA